MVCSLVSIYVDSTQLGIQQKQTVKDLRLVTEICSSFIFLKKGTGIVSPPHFVYNFEKKNVSYVIFY